ncbi:substrate-binding periplasmic protein [Vibrio caribbeanicus]|uniref:Solute-binding protein family 3/N-terminal domain-containing protein n=1 Tax=Vibrio caribbeanicus ATCC BAA-2122 TaxID=796620 RepID=E3BKG0_9VIBR|nr:transporter substrate-binding domain-containing protein [Vibrio caribbeanicus]EFP96545.1 hypothetical protein VIBC2010_05194 [Vibrio caribbeanicus ATCC BAA-2122]
MGTIRSIIIVALSVAFCSYANSTTFTFASIEKLPEQVISARVMTAIYDELGYGLVVKEMPGLRAQESANSGSVDGEIARIFAYGEQTPNVIRVPTPYYSLKTVAYSIDGSSIKVANKDDLNRYKSVIVRGVKHTDKITQDVDPKKVKVMDNAEAMMKFLHKGRAQLALTNPLNGSLTLQKLGYTNIDLAGPPLATLDLYHYIHKDKAELVPIIDKKIIEMRDNGKLQKLLEKTEADVLNNWFN